MSENSERKASAAGKRFFSPSVIPLAITSAIFVVVPLCYIVIISFLERGEYFGVTNVFTFQNYVKMLDPMYIIVFRDALIVALLTTACTLLVAYPFSYAMARLKAKWRGVVMIFLMAPFWLNSLIRLNGVATLLRKNGVINSLLVGAGIIEEPLQMLYTYGAVIFGMVYALLPFMILAIYNSVEKMDWSLVEASRDLGASPVKAFLTVTLPQTLPGIIAGCILVFVPSVGLFYISDLLGGAKSVLLGNLIRTEMLSSRNWPFGAALSIVMLLVTSAAIQLYKKVTKKSKVGGLW
ncbi:MAG: ABC transporter permease [Christensenellales bacterium]|jgi:spermidine/putrescine transport system permease protein